MLDKGHQVFYGPTSEARAYFEGLGYNPLPRQTTPDYLTGCTDDNERQFAPGRSLKDVPSTPEALDSAYRYSQFGQATDEDLKHYKGRMAIEKEDQEAFRLAVAADKKKGVSRSSPYTLGFSGQVWALTKRQFQTRWQDRFQIYTSYTLAIALAFVIGAAYYDQPLSSNGAFTRGGVIFAALLTTCLDAFGEVRLLTRAKDPTFVLMSPFTDARSNVGSPDSQEADRFQSLPTVGHCARQPFRRHPLLSDSRPRIQHHCLLLVRLALISRRVFHLPRLQLCRLLVHASILPYVRPYLL